MLIFLIPLQSPAASKNWDHVSALCQRTLRSVCAQEGGDFRAFLICNQRPLGGFEHPNLTVIEEDFPLPEPNTPSRMADKWRKVRRGLIAARDLAPAHVMIVDADDCVHRGLAALSAREPSAPGWQLHLGYMHDERSPWLYRCAEFHRYCGTSAIVRLELSDFPADMTSPGGDYFIISYGHTAIVDFLRDRGTPLALLPFIGAIYVTDTGENDSQHALRNWRGKLMTLKKLLNNRPFTKRAQAKFGYYELGAVLK